MLLVLPVSAFVILIFLMASIFRDLGWRRAFLRASLLWSAWLVLIVEILSLFHAVTKISLVVMWLLLLGVSAIWLISRWQKGLRPRRPDLSWGRKPGLLLMALALVIVFIMIGLVAWFAPPNTFDSLNYHMSRVAHWAQNHSVAHYANGMEIQNSFAPLAEYSVLNSYVLAGSDRFANFSDWFAMAGSVIGVSIAAALLGAPLAGQFLAALFVATLPMGIAQGSSTMTDYVAGFWLVGVAVEFLSLWGEQQPGWRSVFFLSLAAGLALATKSTAYGFILPFAVATPVVLFRKIHLVQFVKFLALAVLVVGLLSGGYVTRNFRTYGMPFDPYHSGNFRNEMLNWRGFVSNVLRTGFFQFQTPWEAVNLQLLRLVVGVHFKMGLDVNDPRTTIIGEFAIGKPSTHEDTVTNPLHTFLILVTAILSLFTIKRTGKRVIVYQLLVLLGFIAFSFVFKWQVFGSRLLLPFFLIAAPAFGVIFGSILPLWAAAAVGLGLIASSTMWLLSIYARPLFPLDGRTDFDSVLVASREKMYFASIPGAYEPMKNVTRQISESHCEDIGIALSGSGAEYPYWVLLDAPRDDLRIEWIVAGTPSARYSDPDFQPCAVICDTCDDEPSFRGLPLFTQFRDINLYMRK
jgi:hypothetical protein